MPKLTIDGIEYNTEDMSEDALGQVRSLQFVERQIQRLQAEISVCKTAMQAYARALQNNLPEAEVEVELEEDKLEIEEAIVESED